MISRYSEEMVPAVRNFVPVFARVVNSTFGGGSTILAVFRRELVDRRGWLSGDEYALCFAVARITPGTSILAFCAAAGWILGSLRGAILAVLSASLPCASIALAMLLAYDQLREIPWFLTALRGAMAAAIGVMMASGWLILSPYLRSSRVLRNFAIFAGSLALMVSGGLSPVPILGLAALIGFLLPEKEPAAK